MSKSSRARTRDRKQEREKERRRNRQYLIIGGIVVIAVILLGLFALSNLPAEAPIPASIDRYADFEQGLSNNGFPMLGDEDAPVTVVEYSSFSCTHCEEFHETSFTQILERVEEGDIRFVYIPLATGSVPNAEGANRAALCAGEQGKFWEMYDVLFHWHNVFGNTAFQGNRITIGAEALGLNMGAFNSCFNSSRISDLLTLAREDEVGGTPAFKVNDTAVDPTIDAIFAAVDNLLGLNSNDNEPDTNTDFVTEETTPEAEATISVSDDMTEEPEATDEMTPEAEATEE